MLQHVCQVLNISFFLSGGEVFQSKLNEYRMLQQTPLQGCDQRPPPIRMPLSVLIGRAAPEKFPL